jgi:hypothetical protein
VFVSLDDVKRNITVSSGAAQDARRQLRNAAATLDGAVKGMQAATKGSGRGEPAAILSRLQRIREDLETAGRAIGAAVDAADTFGRSL